MKRVNLHTKCSYYAPQLVCPAFPDTNAPPPAKVSAIRGGTWCVYRKYWGEDLIIDMVGIYNDVKETTFGKNYVPNHHLASCLGPKSFPPCHKYGEQYKKH